MATRWILQTTPEAIEAAGGADAFAESQGAALMGVTTRDGVVFVELLNDPSSTGIPGGNTGDELPEGVNQLLWLNGLGVTSVLGIGTNLRVQDGSLQAVGSLDGAPAEINGSAVLELAQQCLTYDDEVVLRTRSCALHNSADETAAVELLIPWSQSVAFVGAKWEVVRAGVFSGAWTINRQVKLIEREGGVENGSAVVVIDTAGLEVGIGVTGDGIPGSTTVDSIDGPNQLTLSANATADGSPTLTFNFGRQGKINGGTDPVTVSMRPDAHVIIRVVASDDAGAAPNIRIEGDLVETSFLLGPLDADGQVISNALLSGATLNGDLNVNGKRLIGNLIPILTAGGTLTVAAHSGAYITTDAAVVIPNTAGFNCYLEGGGSHSITFNGTTNTELTLGDVVFIVVKSSTVIRATRVDSDDLLEFV